MPAAAKTKAPEAAPPAPPKNADMEDVMYHPGPEDRAQTIWNGISFRAGVWVRLNRRNKAHYIECDMPVEAQTHDGYYATKTMPRRMFMAEVAKTNPHFEVRGHPRFLKKLPEGRRPQSAEEYRVYAQAWFADAGITDADGNLVNPDAPSSAREMMERWDDEESMRERLGVGEDDVEYLRSFFDMKVQTLKKDFAIMHAKNDGGAGLAVKQQAFDTDED